MPKPEEDIARHPVVQRLCRGEARRVVVLAGAGISVSAGIPDFRSPGTGLYSNLEKYGLQSPEDVFTLDFFRKDPRPFTLLAREIWPDSRVRPTAAHYFVKLLECHGLLLRHYTQNIDGLDSAAGISSKHLVQAHGSFGAGHCIDCRRPFTRSFLHDHVFRGETARCPCGGLVKPDIVFFGEELPERFENCSKHDFRSCDLIICMGTSLEVEPFASLPSRVPPHVPRILINREVPASFQPRQADLVLLGECDCRIRELAEALGWAAQLEELTLSHKGSSDVPAKAAWHRGALAALAAGVLVLAMRQHAVVGLNSAEAAGVALWTSLVGAIAAR